MRRIAISLTILIWFCAGPAFAQTFSPEDFGAVGDCVSNDAPAIASALSAATATRGVVTFGPRCYATGSAGWTGFAIASKSFFKLEGHGTTLKLLNATTQTDAVGASNPWFKITSSIDWTVEGITFDLGSIAAQAIYSQGHTRAWITRNRFVATSGTNYGVFLIGGAGAHVTDNEFGGVFHAVYLGHTTNPYHETEFVVAQNHMKTLGGGDCVVGTMKRGTITGNLCDGSFSGVALSAYNVQGTFSDTITISGNTFLNQTAHCIQFDIVGTGITNKNITIGPNTCIAPIGSGYYFGGGQIDGLSISGGVIRNPGQSGIVIYPPSTGIAIGGGLVIDGTTGAPAGNGIQVTAENTSNGIVDVSIGDVTVRGFDGSGACGVVLSRNTSGTGKNITISGGTYTLNTRGICIYGAAGTFSNVTIANNTMAENIGYDFRLDSTDVVGVHTNKFTTDDGNLIPAFTNGDTTPSVKGRDRWRVNNTGATNITFLDDGVTGQIVTLEFQNGNTTLVNGGSFLLKSGSNTTPAGNAHVTLEYRGSVWREVSRSY